MQNINSIDWPTERPDLIEFTKPFDIKAYIEHRALYKIKRYFMLSKRSERFYKTIAVFILVFSALVPVILSLSFITNKDMRMLFASISSFLVVVLFSIESVYNFREQWKSYKNAEDEITQELNLFHSSSEPYTTNGEKEKLLVIRVESIVLKERKETIEKLTATIKELEKKSQLSTIPAS
jgi:hypothetical protein